MAIASGKGAYAILNRRNTGLILIPCAGLQTVINLSGNVSDTPDTNMTEVTDNVAMASWYRMTGAVFTENAKILYRALEDKGEPTVCNPVAVPFYYLVSHAAEVFLKCALLKRGFSLKELKSSTLRHSLENLLRELLNRGVPISEPCSELLLKLSRQHETHALRYSLFVDDGEPTFTPEPSDLFSMLDELMLAGRVGIQGLSSAS